MMPDTVIIADPPWQERGGGRRGAQNHYALMPTDAIMAMGSQVRRLAGDNAFLFLWTTSTFLPDALDVMRAWGFKYKSNIVWVKDSIGLGFYVRHQHEVVLIGVRGRPARSRGQHTTSTPSVIDARKSGHSVKPHALHEIAAEFGERRIELFARRRTPGWECHGDELPPLKSPDHSS